MPRIPFDRLPTDARVWIFSASRILSDEEQGRLLADVDDFIDQSGAHSTPLTAARDLRYGRFLFVAVDQSVAGPSGCSIDALVQRIKVLQQAIGVDLVDHAPILFRREDAVERVSRDEFAQLVADGEVGLETTVFNNTLTQVGQVRDGQWEVAVSKSWHAQAFF